MANSMIYIKKNGIVSSKSSVLEQKIYSVKCFSASTFYCHKTSPNTFLFDPKLKFTSVFIN